MKNKNKIIKILFGVLLIIISLLAFKHAIDLFRTYLSHKNFNGCIFAGKQLFPFYEFNISIFLMLYGISMIKSIKMIFKFLIIYNFIITIYFSMRIVVQGIASLLHNSFSFYTIERILIHVGLLFITIFILEKFNYNWKKEIRKFGVLRIIISVILLLLIFKRLNI